jgi:hypothetical protein
MLPQTPHCAIRILSSCTNDVWAHLTGRALVCAVFWSVRVQPPACEVAL